MTFVVCGRIHCCFSLYFVLPAFTPVPLIRPQSGRHRGDGATPSPEQLAEGQKLSREWFATHTCDLPPSPLNRLNVWLDLADTISGKG